MAAALLLILATAVAIGTAGSAQAPRQYHVTPGGDDQGDGTAADPLATIGEANVRVQPGDEVILHAGTYDDQIRPAASGTSNETRITYRPAGDGTVTLQGFPGSGTPAEGAVALGNRHFVTVSGRAPGDPPDTRRIILQPTGFVNSYGNVCGSEGVIVENIEVDISQGFGNLGFVFCVEYWPREFEGGPLGPTTNNILRNSMLDGGHSPFPPDENTPRDPWTEDLVTFHHDAHHNVLEGNTIGTVTHSAIYAYGPETHTNVIRNNAVDNPHHTALSIWSAGVDHPDGASYLVEGNHLSASGNTTNPDGLAGSALQWGAQELIIRHNVLTQGGSQPDGSPQIGGLVGGSGFSYGNPYEAVRSRLYNNTIVDNVGPGIAMYDYGSDEPMGGNVFANNIVHDSHYGSVTHPVEYWVKPATTSTDRYIANTFGNPGGSSGDSFFHSDLDGPVDFDTALGLTYPIDLSPWGGFTNRYLDAGPDDPAHIDAGAPLTTVAATDTGSGTTLVVDDSRFFFGEAAEFPAWMGVRPDRVAVGSSIADAQTARVLATDDATGTITLDQAITRQPGDSVWLWTNSSDEPMVLGSAPDRGAAERAPDPAEPSGGLVADFRDEVMTGNPGDHMDGTVQGVELCSGGFRWDGAHGHMDSNHIWFDPSADGVHTLGFAHAGRVVASFNATAEVEGPLTLIDDNGQTATFVVPTTRSQYFETGWTLPSRAVIVRYDDGTRLAIDNIFHLPPVSGS